jgi:prolyl 4-hydroxylase
VTERAGSDGPGGDNRAMTTTTAITPELRAWIVAQAEAGFAPEDVLAAMRGSGWPEDVAIEAMETTLSAHLQAKGLPIPGVSLPEPPIADGTTRLCIDGHEIDVLLSMKLPRVVVLGGFLSEAECDELVALARPRLARSETVDNETGGSEVNTARTSDGMFFTRGEHPVCERVERRIAALLRWPVVNGEGLQVLRYRPGAEYRPHHDYFDPIHPGTPTILARGGQRVGTLVMYLNTPARGGATTFPEVGLDVKPVKGNAVFFSYHAPHASTKTLHGGAPVLEGEKWVATKWLREREFV